MPKEDRSDWVAVESDVAVSSSNAIRKPTSAYQYFQKNVSASIKNEMEVFDIAEFGRKVRDAWNSLQDKSMYERLAAEDVERYEREMQLADAEALERLQKRQQERLDMLEDEYDEFGNRKRTTRQGPTDNESSAIRPQQPRAVSAKQLEYRSKLHSEKLDKERYILGRQQDLRKEKAAQAKRRLEFLLQQSSIFSHFGNVKTDSAKYRISTAAPASTSRRSTVADDPDQVQQELEEADEHEATYLTSQPSTLGHGQMRDYQLEGLNWMIRLQENGVNGILADEMGLGKTLQSISILVYMMEYQGRNGPHLIVVPKSTLSNWMTELARWAPTIKAIKLHGNKETREELVKTVMEPAMRDEDRDWQVCVTTYEVCNIEKSCLGKFAWSYLIIDEAHRLKNEASTFSKTIRLFETRYRLLLTGTPLQNSLHELWALLNFLVPDVFESSEQFDEWFNLDIDDNDEKNKLISQLHKILRPFMLRRLKADVEKALPPKHETILFTGMSKMQKELYRNILIRDIEAIQGTSGSRTAILNIVMQLRKCAGHPYLFPGVEDRTLPPLGEHLVENCGKMVLLDKLLKRLHERGHRVLLFTQMTRILDILEDYLVMRQYKYCRIDGNTSYEDRERFIDMYNAEGSDKFLFLLSTRSGGLGINLQSADCVIIYDSDWNPQMDLQAQDRAHRIGQKKRVQVFRLVTEHTIEEKIIERAQQKLKLDAMVVQSGRLKEKDKLSRDELLSAVRFGADKIFKSKDSSITDDDIDMILDVGKRKTEELNSKLQAADKGDLLDFKFDGSSVQTFEGVDYSELTHAREAMLELFDIGKRERKEANYNENSLYQQQIAALGGAVQKPKKRKVMRLPKNLRLPRMEEWQMYDREALLKIQEEEENAFRALPEEVQKQATIKNVQPGEDEEGHDASPVPEGEEPETMEGPFELPPLISEEKQALKEKLLSEGFSDWKRNDFNVFLKASGKWGRKELDKVALEIGKPESDVRVFAEAFWGNLGRTRMSEHEYDRAVKAIEKGEKRIAEIKGLERGTRILVSLFDNPWEELEFTHVNCRDKLFTMEEDRYLLCWTRKFGFGHWQAIRLAIRRSPAFRFDYFLRCLPVELLQRRCEQLMKAAEKEVELLERQAREDAGLPVEAVNEGEELPSIELPKFRVIQAQQRKRSTERAAEERKKLEANVEELEAQIRAVKARLGELNEGSGIARVSPDNQESEGRGRDSMEPKEDQSSQVPESPELENEDGALGPDGEFVAFPKYDGSEEPPEWKKPFTHFCVHTRKQVKASLDPADRKDKNKVNSQLKEQWQSLSAEDKHVWRAWSEWDKKRYERDLSIFETKRSKKRKKSRRASFAEPVEPESPPANDDIHVPKKRKSGASNETSVPKKKKR